MTETKVISLLVATLSLSVGQLGAVSFSIDAASGTPAFPDDILIPGGPIIAVPGIAGGGGPDVNGFSYGYAHTSMPLVAGFGFSVDRTSAGLHPCNGPPVRCLQRQQWQRPQHCQQQ